MILPKKNIFQNINVKLNSKTWMTLKSSVVIFQALKEVLDCILKLCANIIATAKLRTARAAE